ncbi:hypothetical protein [Anaerotruncus colihominis]|uniref:hypothetical protein n=1 Tax=Anaerotruncus colihominis TaxID=169435 RepID=UPI0026EEF493|nr:hypothetical protein [Anaerotruncus colihominis]
MKNRKNKNHTFRTGAIVAAAAFIALSFLAGGMIEISRDVGILRWLRDVAVYLFVNKLVEKLFASIMLGIGVAFVSGMIAYGKASRKYRGSRTTQVRFATEESPGVEKTA